MMSKVNKRVEANSEKYKLKGQLFGFRLSTH
jgi:hypothetical protein